MPALTNVRSNKQLIDELRTAPGSWVDVAIVVAFENRFEFVAEDHPDPMGRLESLLGECGLAVGLAGMKPGMDRDQGVFSTQVFKEYAGQGWAHQYMDTLRYIVKNHSFSKELFY